MGSNSLSAHIHIFIGALRCLTGFDAAENFSGQFVYEHDFPDIMKSDFLRKKQSLVFSRENILKPGLEIKASKLPVIMCKIFNNENPKSKHKFLLV